MRIEQSILGGGRIQHSPAGCNPEDGGLIVEEKQRKIPDFASGIFFGHTLLKTTPPPMEVGGGAHRGGMFHFQG
jgi:hypothetical protein